MARTTGALSVAVVLLAGWTVVRAQAPAGTGPVDIMPALLEEVRGLRHAMEQMSTAGPRVQLALGRLQLQEQRINHAIKRADDARARLTQLQREQTEERGRLRGFESLLTERGTRPNVEGPPLEELAAMIKHHKQRLAEHDAAVQRGAAEEALFATEVATEQTRWTEMNQRLEELERGLRPLK
jgi:chromosome segregation ATPase